jgi:hypothetical protein
MRLSLRRASSVPVAVAFASALMQPVGIVVFHVKQRDEAVKKSGARQPG